MLKKFNSYHGSKKFEEYSCENTNEWNFECSLRKDLPCEDQLSGVTLSIKLLFVCNEGDLCNVV